jgi:hypothetical protein
VSKQDRLFQENLMRKTTFVLTLIAPLAVAAAQNPDPTVRVQAATLPAGWTLRLDDKETDATASDTKFVAMGSGFHVTSGPASIYFNPANTVTGSFTASASFRQTRAPMHPEAYGLFFAGANLKSDQQSYLYFLVRGDGKYYVAHRAGADVHRITPWTDNAAIVKQDANGVATNVLSVQATADSVHLLVNGTRIQSFARGGMLSTDGQVGLRVNHNLDVHIGSFEVKKN